MTRRPRSQAETSPENLVEATRRIERARRDKNISLHLAGLSLTKLPKSIGELSQLRELHLDNNRLAALPESLRNLKRLEELFLHGNPSLGLPAEVLGPRWGEPGILANPA